MRFLIPMLAYLILSMSTNLLAQKANSAPVLYNEGEPVFSDVVQNTLNPAGDLISTVISTSTANNNDMITDDDSDPEGIAIVETDTRNGSWQYSTNNGSSWINFALHGELSEGSALLLSSNSTHMLRFIPNTGFMGLATITIKAWDGTSGSDLSTIDATNDGGATAFSSTTEQLEVNVIPANGPAKLTVRTGSIIYKSGIGTSDFSIDPTLIVEDPENDNVTKATIAIVEGFKSGFDYLDYTTTNGITGSAYSNTDGVIVLTKSGGATPLEFQEALRNIEFRTTDNSENRVVKISITLGNTVYNYENGHFYDRIIGAKNWEEARDDAKTKYYLGKQGYLATITSDSEQQFISKKLQLNTTDVDAWIGGKRDDHTTWSFPPVPTNLDASYVWVTGPEGLMNDNKGLPFFRKRSNQTLSTLQGREGNNLYDDPYDGNLTDLDQSISGYNCWHPDEPNMTTQPGYLWIGYGDDDKWDDTESTNANVSGGYIIEYGGFDGELTFETAGSVTIEVKRVSANTTIANLEGTGLNYTEGDGEVSLTSSLTINSTVTLTGATISLTGYIENEDQLSFVDGNGIEGSWSSRDGILTLSGNGNITAYQDAIRSIKYSLITEDPTETQRAFVVTLDDGNGSSNSLSRNINITATNDKPVISDLESSDLTYTEGDPAKNISSLLVVSDPDNENIVEAVISISSGFETDDDLQFVNSGNISGSYNDQTGVLTLSGTSSLENYTTALKSVKYFTDSGNPSTSKTISIKVKDESGEISEISSRTIKITAINDAPKVTSPPTITPVTRVGDKANAFKGNWVDDDNNEAP